MKHTPSLLRALRAANAVTLGSSALLLGACGTTQSQPPRDAGLDGTPDSSGDVGGDVTPDTPADVTPDLADVGPACLDEADDLCPDGCTPENDADCCTLLEPTGWCTYNPEWGCSCAVEGPFAPPCIAARRRRAVPAALR
jgi:hypothetical protein